MRLILSLYAFMLSSAPAWALGGFITGNEIDTPEEQSTLMMMVGLLAVLIIAFVVNAVVKRMRRASGL